MATSSNVWAMNNDGWEDGLKNVFEPRKLADEEFKRGQGIIKDAYAIDEQQALLPTKLAESMVNRRKAEANLQYYEENPNALVDAIGSEANRVRVFNENQIGENQAKITARTEQQARDELIASKSFITTPEQLNPDGSVRVPATERPTTEIERLELAATAAPTYKMQQDISAMVKTKYTDVVNQAVAQEDYVGAHEAAKKAGLITGDAKLTRLSDDTYTIQTTYGGTRQIGKQALQQMFFSQATKEKLAVANNEAAGRIAVETLKGNYDLQGRRITADSNQTVANTRAAAQLGAAQIGYDRSVDTANIRTGGTAQGAQSGVANPYISKQAPTNQFISGTLPVSHNHPTYDKADDLAAQKVGIPSEFLKSIRLYGERTNADKVSEAGAKGVYQFIPATRNAIKSKYGVDAWSTNPEEAATAAAYLVKENYDAAKANPRGKTPEEEMFRLYHAGATATRGKVNEDYAVRTMSGLRDLSAQPQQSAQPQARYSNDAAAYINANQSKFGITDEAAPAFKQFIASLPPERQKWLNAAKENPRLQTEVDGIMRDFSKSQGATTQVTKTQTAKPATQSPAMPQSTAPAMPQQAATEPNVKASGTPDLPASQSVPRQPETLKDFISGLSLSEIRAMQDDIATVEKTTGATPQSKEAKQLLAAAATGENLKYAAKASATGLATGAKQTLESAGIVGTAYDYLVNSYKESVKRGEEYDAKQKKESLDFLKGLQELQQARKK